MQPLKLGRILEYCSMSPELDSDDITINIARMPTGPQFYFIAHNNHFFTEIDGYDIKGSLTHNDTEVSLSVSAAKEGK